MRRVVVLSLAVILLVASLLAITVFRRQTQAGRAAQREIKSWAYQLQNASPEEIARSEFDLVVIDYSRDGTEEGRYTREEIEMMKRAGVIPVAYISIGEAEDYRWYWNESWYENPPEWLGRENPEWPGCYAVKYWHPEWQRIAFEYLDKIIEQGFMGVYLDKVDEFEHWADPSNGEGAWYPENLTAKWMIDFICRIAEHCRAKAGQGFLIIPQNGERLLDYGNGTLLRIVSGWAVEDLFYNGVTPLPENVVEERVKYLMKVKAERKLVLVVDYVDDGSGYCGENKERIDDFIRRCREFGFVPYAARVDRELDELVIIEGVQPPPRPVMRVTRVAHDTQTRPIS